MSDNTPNQLADRIYKLSLDTIHSFLPRTPILTIRHPHQPQLQSPNIVDQPQVQTSGTPHLQLQNAGVYEDDINRNIGQRAGLTYGDP